MSTDENVVADNWEEGGADAVKAIEKRFEQVKILQRKQEDKDALIEKTKTDTVDDVKTAPKILTKVEDDTVAEGPGPSQEEPKRVLLRRPKDSNPVVSNGHHNHGSHHRGSRQPNNNPPPQRKTLEERQNQYKEARARILGSEYKPDNSEIKEIVVVERSKSPETITISRASSTPKLPLSYDRDFGGPNGMNIPPLMQQQTMPPHQQQQSQMHNGRSPYAPDYGMTQQNLHLQQQQQNSASNQNQVFESPLQFEISSFMPPPGFGAQQIPSKNEQRLYLQMNGCYKTHDQQMYENTMKLQMAAAAAATAMMNSQQHQQMQNMENQNAQYFSFSNQTNYNMGPYSMPPQYQQAPPNTQIPPPNYSQPPPPKGQNGPMLYSQAMANNGQLPQVQQQQQQQQQRGPPQQKKRNSNGTPDNIVPYPPNFNYPPPSKPTMGGQMGSQQNPIPFGCPPRSVNQYSGQQQSQMVPNHGLGLMGPPPTFNHPTNAQMAMNVHNVNGMMRNGPMRQGGPNQ